MTDLLTGNNGDLQIVGNDLQAGYSDEQHKEHLLISQPGQIKEDVSIGVGIEDFLNDSDISGMLAKVREQFEKDGMEVNSISFNEQTGDLNEDAEYTS